MKKLIIIIGVFIAASCYAQSDSAQTDSTRADSTAIKECWTFRGISWGASMQTVRATEKAPLTYETESGLGFSTELSGDSVLIYYYFIKDSAVGAAIMFNETHSSDNLYLDDFNSVSKRLQEKYGEAKVEYNWSRNLYKNDIGQYGFAVSIGDLNLLQQWKLKGALIQHILEGDKYKIKHRIMYFSTQYQHLRHEQKAQEAKEGF